MDASCASAPSCANGTPANSRNSGTCLGKPAFAYGPSSSAVADFGSGWAAVNGWRGNTDLAERIRFDLELMTQRATCITLRAAQEALSVWSRERPIYGFAFGIG